MLEGKDGYFIVYKTARDTIDLPKEPIISEKQKRELKCMPFESQGLTVVDIHRDFLSIKRNLSDISQQLFCGRSML